MAYMNQEKKAAIRAALVKVVPSSWKWTLGVRHHSTIVFTIRSAPVDFHGAYRGKADVSDRSQMKINQYWLEDCWAGELLETLQKIKAALNLDNHDNSEPQTDYFDVGHYVDIQVGAWDKPYVIADATNLKQAA